MLAGHTLVCQLLIEGNFGFLCPYDHSEIWHGISASWAHFRVPNLAQIGKGR